MTRLSRFGKNLATGILALATFVLPLAGQAGDVPMPDVPEAQRHYSADSACVAPVAEMRKNHMQYILHQRDETMHEGIRTRQFSLEECINCHVPKNTDVRVESPKHFCNSCHTYAAVKIDCFECHADRPVTPTSFHPMTSGRMPHHGDEISLQEGLSEEALLVLSNQGSNQE